METITMSTCSVAGRSCDMKSGPLPSCAPLAAAYVPIQSNDPPQYTGDEALTRGTLFPGLDLPFKNVANKTNPYAGTPLGELLSLQFMMKEMQLYLDTHKDDKVVFDALKDVIKLYEAGKKTYVEMYGPLTLPDVKYSSRYTWVDGPWPWEYSERMGKN